MEHKPPARLGPGRYVALTTYETDGSPVTARVWATKVGGLEYVVVDSHAGKVRRILNNPLVNVARCNHDGSTASEAVPARARILGPEFTRVTINWLQLSYGWLFRSLMKVERGKIEKKVVIAIKLSS